jgi:hypothetical protein
MFPTMVIGTILFFAAFVSTEVCGTEAEKAALNLEAQQGKSLQFSNDIVDQAADDSGRTATGREFANYALNRDNVTQGANMQFGDIVSAEFTMPRSAYVRTVHAAMRVAANQNPDQQLGEAYYLRTQNLPPGTPPTDVDKLAKDAFLKDAVSAFAAVYDRLTVDINGNPAPGAKDKPEAQRVLARLCKYSKLQGGPAPGGC